MKNKENEMYICYETYQVKSFHDWRIYYEESVDKTDYADFDVWWMDMRKSGVLEMADEIIFQGEEKCEKYIVFKHGENDFSILYDKSYYSIRGSKDDVIKDYLTHFEKQVSSLTKDEYIQLVVNGLRLFCKRWKYDWYETLKKDLTAKTFFRLFTKNTRTYFFEYGSNHYDVEFLKDERVLVKRCGHDYGKRDFDIVLSLSEVLEAIN